MSEEQSYDIGDLCTDEKAEVEGVWRDLPRGAKIKVARWQNKEFQRMMRRNFKSNRVILEQEDDVSDSVSEEILIKVMAHTVLRDITGAGFKGKLIEKYTPDIGIELLKVKDFREKVRAYSEDFNSFSLKQEDAAVKS